jgi:hypothetical protein
MFCFLTGKTVLLVLQALKWLKQELDVHVVSTRHQTMAASFQIENQLQETIKDEKAYPKPDSGKVSDG